MMSPTMQQDGKVRLLQDAPKATEKTISFFNAYCTHLELSFQPGRDGGAGSCIIQLQISSQRVAVGAIVHDNNWPLASHGSGDTFAKQEQPTAKKAATNEPSGTPPGALSDAIHTTLDVVGMIPLLGEVADGANAAMYAAEGDYANAALSAAAMVPLIGNVATGAKLGKRALKVADVALHQARGSGFDGVRQASNFLKEAGVPRKFRKQIIESFEKETISMKIADEATHGLRFYDNITAFEKGRYLFPQFTNYTNRVGLALPPDWNKMTHITQFQVRPGTKYILGRAASQGGRYTGGSYQMYINTLTDLIKK